MNTTRLIGPVLGGTMLSLLMACSNSAAQPSQANATKTAHQVCSDETVTTQKPVKDKDHVLGTIAGAVVGGVVGHEVGGHGTGQDIATAGGAVAGGYAGNRVQKSVQDNATEQTTKRVCHTEYE